MLVILNSDVARSEVTGGALSEAHAELVEACRAEGHIIVLPLTAKLEFDRWQGEVRASRVKKLQDAFGLLERHGVHFESTEPSSVIDVADLATLYEAAGVHIRIEEPTLEDYQDAHRRACMHDPPHPPNTKQDEMRDLVIWAQALRLAKANDGAILLSRDDVHLNDSGNHEAQQGQLIRRQSIEEALVDLHIETPTAQTVLAILKNVWDPLRKSGLPLPQDPALIRATNPVFVLGRKGLASAGAEIVLPGEGGTIEASLRAVFDAEALEVQLTDVRIDGLTRDPVRVTAEQFEDIYPTTDYADRLEALRRAGSTS